MGKTRRFRRKSVRRWLCGATRLAVALYKGGAHQEREVESAAAGDESLPGSHATGEFTAPGRGSKEHVPCAGVSRIMAQWRRNARRQIAAKREWERAFARRGIRCTKIQAAYIFHQCADTKFIIYISNNLNAVNLYEDEAFRTNVHKEGRK